MYRNHDATALLDLFLDWYRKHDNEAPITTDYVLWFASEMLNVTDISGSTVLGRLKKKADLGCLSMTKSHAVHFEYEFYPVPNIICA